MPTIQKRDSENMSAALNNGDDARVESGLKKSKSSSEVVSKTATEIALETWGMIVSNWGEGKFNSPTEAEALFEKFFSKDCTIDATHGCAGLHSKFKMYGFAELQEWFNMLVDTDNEGLKINFVASPTTEGEVWHHFEIETCTNKATGKKVHNTSGVVIINFEGAKVSKIVQINHAPAAFAAMYSNNAEDVVPQHPALPSFEPAADPKAAFEALFGRWAAGDFSHAETKEALCEQYITSDCVLDYSSHVMPSLFKVYTGHAGFEAWNSGVVAEQWDLSNMEVAVTTGLKPGCVLMKVSCDIKHKTTSKEVKGAVSYQEGAYNAEGKFVHVRVYWTDPAAIAAIHTA